MEKPRNLTARRINLEIPIFGARDARLAVSSGAGRLELNAAGSYDLGGTTPSLSELRAAVEQLSSMDPVVGGHTVPIRIMIRPRGPPPNPDGQDFIYTESEISSMVQAIREFKLSGLLRAERGDGFVFGILRHREDGGGGVEVDVENNSRLVGEACPLSCVFHRAFDNLLGAGAAATVTSITDDFSREERRRHQRLDIEKAVEAVRSCGFDGVLTSGGKGNAPDRGNRDRLSMVIALAGTIEVIVGGGVRSGNLGALKRHLEASDSVDPEYTMKRPLWWYHSSCITSGGNGRALDGEEVSRLVDGPDLPVPEED